MKTTKKPASTDIKTEWDFSHMYKGYNDPKIEKDVLGYVRLFKIFANKYKDKKFIKNTPSLVKALEDYTVLMEKGSPVALWYVHLEKLKDTTNTNLQARVTRLDEIFQKGTKEILFFPSAISKIELKKQTALLKDKRLVDYKYFLQNLFTKGRYTLSDAEEKVITDKDSIAHTAWVDAFAKYKNSQKVKKGSKEISIGEAMAIKSDLPRKERRVLHKAVMQKYKDISFMAEAEMNAVIRNKKNDDELRGYKTPYESTILGYQNDVKSIENLVDVVTKSNPISHRFHDLKRKILNKAEGVGADEKMTMADTATGIATSKTAAKTLSFGDSVKMIKDAFTETDPEFGTIFQQYVDKGQIDVFPAQGKHTGAFCWSVINSKYTYILLNFSGKLRDVSTLAHEMGHGIHWDLSKSQPAHYQDFTTSVAEVASTFFENVLFDKLLEVASPEEKKDLLLGYIQDRVFSIFSQVAYFQFEKKLHAAVREQGYVSKEEMAKMFADCRRSYLGDAVEIVEEDGYAFTYISHFRTFFYVYSYAYGQLIADALYAEYKKDKKFIEKVKKFLRAGGSMSPADIFKSIGIDTTKPDFFKKGLKKLSDDIDVVSKMG